MNEIQRLRDRVGEVEEENRQLKEEIGIISSTPNAASMRRLGLSPSMYQIFGLLVKTKIVRKSLIERTLWPDPDLEPENSRTVIAVHLSRLRKVMTPYAVSIENVRGVGWRLSDGSVPLAESIMAELTK